MNVGSWLLWGFVGSVVLTAIMAGAQGLGLTRMALPYMLGSMFTPNRDLAKLIGFNAHLIDGWIFSLIYVLAFEQWHAAGLYRGAAIGFVHGAFVLTAGMRMMPGLHPRMASEQHGPTAQRQLEPPGFLALNYGYQTPLYLMLAHIVFGAIIGGFYHVSS